MQTFFETLCEFSKTSDKTPWSIRPKPMTCVVGSRGINNENKFKLYLEYSFTQSKLQTRITLESRLAVVYSFDKRGWVLYKKKKNYKSLKIKHCSWIYFQSIWKTTGESNSFSKQCVITIIVCYLKGKFWRTHVLLGTNAYTLFVQTAANNVAINVAIL